MQKPTLFLIDGMSCAYRAFYAIPGLQTSSGEPTNAVYGFINMLLKIIREQKPDAVAVFFDCKAPTFRHERFEAYKAQRKPMPEALGQQIPVIKEVIDSYRIRRMERERYEADDLMGSMAVRAAASGYSVYMVTSDKDLLQLVDENIRVFRPDGGGVYDEEAVRKRYGVAPKGIVEILALAGDQSDNVPGIPGIGEKTAIKLITEFGDLEGVLKNTDSVTGEKRRENLRRFEEQARLSRDLVLLKTDIPLEFDPDECRMKEPDRKRVSELFRRLEFTKLQADVADVERVDERKYRVADDGKSLGELVERLKKRKDFSYYLVPDPSGAPGEDIRGMAFCWGEGEACYLPFGGGVPDDLIVSLLGPLLRDGGIEKVGHDFTRDILALRRFGIALKGAGFDTMLAAYLLNPSKGRYGLDDLALEHLGLRLRVPPEAGGGGAGEADGPDLLAESVCEHACESADMVLRLKNLILPLLESRDMLGLLRDLEIPVAEAVAGMEEEGVRIDTGFLEGLSGEYGKELEKLEESIYSMAGEEFNINSPQQLGRVLFEKLQLPASRKTKRGYSTDYDTLTGLSRLHPLPSKILEYRSLSKLKSTYLDTLPRLADTGTGRIHSSFHQTGTATGRFSSSNPNLQNIPVRTDIGRKIREAFLPRDETMIFLSADYSQIDLRVLAHLSGDGELIQSFRNGDDIHVRTASAVFGVDASRVDARLRRQAKTINFGIVYGMGPHRLAHDLGIGFEEAREFIDRYFTRYSGVKEFIDRCIREAESRGYVTTVLNRRRYVPQLTSRSRATREFGKRIAINTPIQGSSADLIKISMRDIHREISSGNWNAAMLIQIHDELLFEVGRDDAREFGEMVKQKMEEAAELRVPLITRLKTGENWGEIG